MPELLRAGGAPRDPGRDVLPGVRREDRELLRGRTRAGEEDLVRIALYAALGAALAMLTLVGCSDPPVAPRAAVAPPTSIAAPVPVAAPPIVTGTVEPETTTTRRPTTSTTTTRKAPTSMTPTECIRFGNTSTMSNAELIPYLRARGCGAVLDALREHAEATDGVEDDSDVDIDSDYSSSGEAQYDWGCQQGYITEGC